MHLPAFLVFTFGLLGFNPILAHAELSDISRIFRQTPQLKRI